MTLTRVGFLGLLLGLIACTQKPLTPEELKAARYRDKYELTIIPLKAPQQITLFRGVIRTEGGRGEVRFQFTRGEDDPQVHDVWRDLFAENSEIVITYFLTSAIGQHLEGVETRIPLTAVRHNNRITIDLNQFVHTVLIKHDIQVSIEKVTGQRLQVKVKTYYIGPEPADHLPLAFVQYTVDKPDPGRADAVFLPREKEGVLRGLSLEAKFNHLGLIRMADVKKDFGEIPAEVTIPYQTLPEK